MSPIASESKLKSIAIANKKIGLGRPCMIIAEAGVNHNGSEKMALELVDIAYDAGADAVMTLMRYAFEELGFERLDTTIIAHNEASLNLYVGKCGWVEEGRQKNWYWRRNRYWDKVN